MKVGNKIKEWARKRKWRLKVKTWVLCDFVATFIFRRDTASGESYSNGGTSR